MTHYVPYRSMFRKRPTYKPVEPGIVYKGLGLHSSYAKRNGEIYRLYPVYVTTYPSTLQIRIARTLQVHVSLTQKEISFQTTAHDNTHTTLEHLKARE